MDHLMGLSKTRTQHDLIWHIDDRMTKFAHFIPVRYTYTAKDYPSILIDELSSHHISRDPSKRA